MWPYGDRSSRRAKATEEFKPESFEDYKAKLARLDSQRDSRAKEWSMENVWTREQTFDAVAMARKIFGDRQTTRGKYEAMEKGLGLAYLHCPEELRDSVWATALEATMRRVYYEMNIWRKAEAS